MPNIEIPTPNMERKPDVCINMEDSPRFELVNVVESLTSSITRKLDTLPTDTYIVSIYKVSEKYRKVNEEAYTPRLVSIGPLHHGKSQLQVMEAYKLRCLQSFRNRFSLSVENLIKFAAQEQGTVRGSYEDTVEFDSKKFSEMVLLDGIFVLELLLKNYFVQLRDRNDVIFDNRWMASDIMHDMLLLENQLPLSFTSQLFNFVDASLLHHMSFLELSREYFKNVGNTKRLQLTEECQRARHLVELLLYLHQPSSKGENTSSSRIEKFEYTRSASELQEAGVQFKGGTGEFLFDVSFKMGVLTVPRLTINEWSETFFRNLIAFEQCGHYYKNITSYIILMDSLINTSKDVDLLVECKIIDNSLGESQLVADLFNTIYKEVVPEQSNFYFANICKELDKYSKDYFHEWKSAWFKWKIIARRDYFSNPWSIISVVAACFLLLLTIIQAVCSILQVK